MIMCRVSFLQTMVMPCGVGTCQKPCCVQKLFTEVHALTARKSIDLRGFPQVKSWIRQVVSPRKGNPAGMAYAVSWMVALVIDSRIWPKMAKVAKTRSGVGKKQLLHSYMTSNFARPCMHACVDHDMAWNSMFCSLHYMDVTCSCCGNFMLWHLQYCQPGIALWLHRKLLVFAPQCLVPSGFSSGLNSLTLASGHGSKTSFTGRGTQTKSC